MAWGALLAMALVSSGQVAASLVEHKVDEVQKSSVKSVQLYSSQVAYQMASLVEGGIKHMDNPKFNNGNWRNGTSCGKQKEERM